MAVLRLGTGTCDCRESWHRARLIVLTGGPGAGKTAVLDLASRSFCSHVAILPEAASIVFGGGFPRHDTAPGRRAGQRAIYRVQREVERLVVEEGKVAVGLCDRGTLDGLAYWPDEEAEFWSEMATTREEELERYHALVHLESPGLESGYRRSEMRVESAPEAHLVDRRLAEVWSTHPRRVAIGPSADFEVKAQSVLETVRAALPPCCRRHPLVTK